MENQPEICYLSRLFDTHKKYERKQVAWLLITYLIIGLMAAAVMLYAAGPIFWAEYFRP